MNANLLSTANEMVERVVSCVCVRRQREWIDECICDVLSVVCCDLFRFTNHLFVAQNHPNNKQEISQRRILNWIFYVYSVWMRCGSVRPCSTTVYQKLEAVPHRHIESCFCSMPQKSVVFRTLACVCMCVCMCERASTERECTLTVSRYYDLWMCARKYSLLSFRWPLMLSISPNV